ncbi:MAG: FAD-dependent oxidoreductase, partial [Alphaproteobacteria bacterium]
AYTPDAADARDPERLLATMEARFLDAFPELRGMRVLHRFPQVRWDFPGFPPGAAANRLRTAGPVPGIAFAGDWVRIPTPAALMEGAVTSGIEAANEIGRLHALSPHENWSVPTRGILTRVMG